MKKKNWKEFRETGLLWFVNSILHLFGWVLVLDIDTDTREVIEAYPARCNFRGFCEKHNTKGYAKVTKYLKENIDQLLEDTEIKE